MEIRAWRRFGLFPVQACQDPGLSNMHVIWKFWSRFIIALGNLAGAFAGIRWRREKQGITEEEKDLLSCDCLQPSSAIEISQAQFRCGQAAHFQKAD
jgi:hypothetical protein